MVKNPPANAGDRRDMGLIPGLGRYLGRGNGNLLQDSCLENPMNREAWRATVSWRHKELDMTEGLTKILSILSCFTIFKSFTCVISYNSIISLFPPTLILPLPTSLLVTSSLFSKI